MSFKLVFNPFTGVLDFYKEGEGSGGGSIETPKVDNYDALPDPSTQNNKFYWVRNTQGTRWLPGSFGGTYYPKGWYYSDGVIWDHTDNPFQASQVDVDAGIIDDQFVSPYTLNNWNKIKEANLYLNFVDVEPFEFVAPYNLKFTSVESNNGAVVDLDGYVLGNTLNKFDVLNISINQASFIILKGEKV
jgi:hypothetical protein